MKLGMRDEKELSRGRTEGKVFSIQAEGMASPKNRRETDEEGSGIRVIWKGRQGWVLVGPVGRRRQSLDFILILVKCHMPQRTLRKG